uniref:Uncharacterized protein n=1 Tax=Ananas comosus var. bracteatus TaxID=296719 RepID=A0A6V7Q2T0_ANACO|nr:unnamed protein product [Ananas comosus var. bracteatus]
MTCYSAAVEDNISSGMILTCSDWLPITARSLNALLSSFYRNSSDSTIINMLLHLLLNSTRVVNQAMASCRKKKSESDSFLADVRDHIDEFVDASMDEHKSCFQKTIQKMFGMSKVVAERAERASETKEIESPLPLQTTVSQ